jgi:tetratricopeptide (TPR) repeat protein
VAVYIVFAIALLEVIMLISIFWLRAMVVPVNTNPPKAKSGLAGAPYVPHLPHVSPTPAVPEVDNHGVARLPGLDLHAGRLNVPTESDKQAQVSNLNDEANVFLRQNDYQSALDLLIKAEDLDPRSPTTLNNLAETYNLMNDSVLSRVYWQRIVDLGQGVGTIYGKAKDHVLLLDSGGESNPLREPSSLPRQIFVSSVEKSPVDVRQGAAQFEVRAVLKRRDPNMPNFDQAKLQPYVIFYQQMPDGSLVPDLAQRKGAFEDSYLFSGGKNAEAFSVTYIMPIPGTPGPNGTTQGEYYGFVIGLYYDKTLQDVRSEPSDLCTRMALPQEIE